MNIDLLDPGSFRGGHPHQQYQWLRSNAPCYHHDEPNGPGFWVVTKYDDVYNIGRDAATYSSEPTIMIADPDLELASLSGPQKMMLISHPCSIVSFTAVRRI